MIELSTLIEQVPKIGPAYQKKLKKLGIKTVSDLLFYFPQRYNDFSNIVEINKVKNGTTACVQGKIIEIATEKSFKKWMDITEATIEDETGQIRALWFNQPYITTSLKEDDIVCLAGKISLGKGGIYFNNPAYEKITDYTEIKGLTHTGRIVPVYSETKGLTSRWLRYIIKPLLASLYKQVPEILPQEILKKHKFLPIEQAIWQAHFPDYFEGADAAKARFSFEELFLLQISVLQEKAKLMLKKAPACPMDTKLMKEFVKSLPFELTDSQRQCAFQILKDLEKPVPMSRLLEGDVGSGKTVVATMAALNTVKSHSTSSGQGDYQVAFMAPTEILAKQHFKSITELLKNFDVSIGFLTGKESQICKVGPCNSLAKSDFTITSKKELLEMLKNGRVDILIGTHALISRGVEFKNLAFIVLDEQHRFGVAQRQALGRGPTQTETQTNADHEDGFLYEDLTYKIRKCLFAVKKDLGLGHKEVIYQKALAEKFSLEGIKFEKELMVPIIYNNKRIGTYQPDFVVENKIILELKALPLTGDTEKKQVWSYLKGSSYKLALLANFSSKDIEISRIVYDTARSGQRKSAYSQRESANRWVPHLLSMTATPIPRTLALTVYGDLDLSLIKEMPKGREKVKTVIVGPNQRKQAYKFIESEVEKGRGVFVICPKIEPKSNNQDTRNNNQTIPNIQLPISNIFSNEIKSVKQEYEKLSKEIFPNLKIAMMHGKLKPAEKEKIMMDFKNGKIDIVVSTSVIEVGVDVPRATVMMIEGAERFGLSQLHQFRGRVGRSNVQSYCFLFTTDPSQLNRKRLKAMIESNSGFELAQKDLEIRGPGQLYGNQQWGLPDIAMQGLSNIFLVEKTRNDAKELLEKDPELKNYPLLKERAEKFNKNIHFE